MGITNAAQWAEEEYMEINTRYGRQIVAKSSLLSFPQGLPGFDELREFKLFHEEGTSTVFYLQSTEDPDVRLPVVTPGSCNINYRIELDDSEEQLLRAGPDDDMIVVLTLSDNQDNPQSGITANLMAPIIINASSRIGMQKSLHQIQGGVVIDALIGKPLPAAAGNRLPGRPSARRQPLPAQPAVTTLRAFSLVFDVFWRLVDAFSRVGIGFAEIRSAL